MAEKDENRKSTVQFQFATKLKSTHLHSTRTTNISATSVTPSGAKTRSIATEAAAAIAVTSCLLVGILAWCSAPHLGEARHMLISPFVWDYWTANGGIQIPDYGPLLLGYKVYLLALLSSGFALAVVPTKFLESIPGRLASIVHWAMRAVGWALVAYTIIAFPGARIEQVTALAFTALVALAICYRKDTALHLPSAVICVVILVLCGVPGLMLTPNMSAWPQVQVLISQQHYYTTVATFADSLAKAQPLPYLTTCYLAC